LLAFSKKVRLPGKASTQLNIDILKKGATLSIACKCLGSKWGAADKDENLKALAGVLSLPPCTLGPQNKSFVPNISENGCKTINWGKSREPKCLKPHAVNRIYL
jgi:hypothetical protein